MTCPALTTYTVEFQHNAAAEIAETQGHNEHLKRLVADYKRFRDVCRKINAIKRK